MKVNRPVLFAVLVVFQLTLFTSITLAAVRINFWTWYSDTAYKKPMEQLLLQFMKENPDIKVTHSVYDFGSIGDKYLTTVVGGKSPDVVLVSSRWMVQMAYAGAFMPLESFMTRDGINSKDVYQYLWNGVTYKGKKYAIPFAGGNQQALWYNKDMFSAAGIDPRNNPKTLSELLAASLKLSKDKNNDGKPDVFGIDNSVIFQSMLLAAGGDWVSADGSRLLWNSDQGVAAMTFMYDLTNKHRVNGGTWGTSFEQAKAGMHLEGPYYISKLKKVAKFQYGLGLHPQAEDAKEPRMWASSDALALSKKSKAQMEAGWKLIKFLTRADIQAKWSVSTGFPPQVRSATHEPVFTEAAKAEPFLAIGASLSEYATSFYPCIKDMDLESLSSKYTSLVMTQKYSPRQALDRAVDEGNRLLSRFFYKKK